MNKKREYVRFSLLFLILSLLISANINAATLTWTGGGADTNASTAENWSGNIAPQDGDRIVYDSTDINSTWDLSITLASISKYSGYTGEFTKTSGATLTIAKTVTWIGGNGNNEASIAANWTGGSVPSDGDKIIFNDTSLTDCIWDISIIPDLLSINSQYTGTIRLNNQFNLNGNLTVSGGTFDLNNQNIDIDGYIAIGAGGTLNATSSTITVSGDWLNAGQFISGTSTVVLDGTYQTIYGDTTFYNLLKTVSTADTLYFQTGSTQTVSNSLTLQGALNELLSLTCDEYKQSQSCSDYWYLDPQGTRNISYVSVNYLSNINFVNIVTTNSVDDGNNNGVSFGGGECVCRDDNVIFSKLFNEDRRGTC